MTGFELMMPMVTVTESVLVRRPRQVVWDFTQDYLRRREWDASILEASVIHQAPTPRVQIRSVGGLRAVFQYRQFDRPSRTSLSMEEVQSFLIFGGGGSWAYDDKDGGTLWTQTNTLTLKPGWWRRLLAPLIRRQLKTSTRRAMQKAKKILEASA